MYINDAVRVIADDPATSPLVRQAFQRLIELLDTEEVPWTGAPTPPPQTIAIHYGQAALLAPRSDERPREPLGEPRRPNDKAPTT